MHMEMQIVCKNFKQMDVIDNKIIVDDESEEYYIIPLNKSYDVYVDGDMFVLLFTNQLLWLKYSNHKKEILLKDCELNECVVIPSDLMYDVFIKLDSTCCFRKNVWHCANNVYMNKQYLGNYFLVLPIFDDNMIDIFEYGEGIKNYQVEIFTNEVLLRECLSRDNNHGYISITNNVLLNKDALFVRLYDEDVESLIML